MTQAVSNLISTLSAGNTAQRSSRMADSSQTDTHQRFDQILEKTQDNRQSDRQAADTSSDKVRNGAGKEKDDNTAKSKLKKDDQAVTSSDEDVTSVDAVVEQEDDHDDDLDATDVALAAAAVQVTEQAQQQQNQQSIPTAVAATSDDSALSAALNTDASKPLFSDQKHKATTDSQTSDDATTQKQPSVSDALLRLLSVSTAQTSATTQQQAALNVTEGQLVQAQSSDQSANQQAVPLPTTSQSSSDQQDSTNVARVSRALQNAIHQKGGTITIRMMPPELGQVRVDIQMHGGKVSANFQTEQESVQTLMSREMSQLRQALEKQGLTVERLQVTHRPAASQNANASGQESQQQQTPSDGRSRGRYARQSFASTGNGSSSSEEQDSFASQLSQV